jgi:hypothetical protein
MFIIKMLDTFMTADQKKPSELVIECDAYGVSYHEDTPILEAKWWNDDSFDHKEYKVKNVAYIINRDGKTIDKICAKHWQEQQ